MARLRARAAHIGSPMPAEKVSESRRVTCASFLADLKSADGFVSKDTVAGGYGSRLRPFESRGGHVPLKRRLHDPPSVQMGYLAAIAANRGHDVLFTSAPEAFVDGDVALVLSSLVDYRNETAWADSMRARGSPRRLHRPCRVEDAGSLPRSRRFPRLRRTGRSRDADARRRASRRHRRERATRRPRRRCRSRAGISCGR